MGGRREGRGMNKYSIEVIRRVFDDSEGVCIEVGSCQDGTPGVVSIYTTGEKNKEWYGSLYLAVAPDQARLLAVAILARADEAEKETK